LAAAYSLLTEGNNAPVHLVTGPPLLYAAEQSHSFKESLSNYQSVLRFAGEEKFHVVRFDRVTVFPQGAAVIYHIFGKQPELEQPGKVFVIVEPGYKTTEILMFEITQDKRIAPVSGYSTTLELGMNFVEKAIDETFFQKTGSKLIPSRIDKIMKGQSTVPYQGNSIDLWEVYLSAKDELVRNIVDGVTQVLGDQIDDIDKLLFAGGVVADSYIASRLKESFKANIEIIEDSQFSNARGMLKVAELVEAKEQRKLNVI
jgi:plasmid segregation protein ParM